MPSCWWNGKSFNNFDLNLDLDLNINFDLNFDLNFKGLKIKI